MRRFPVLAVVLSLLLACSALGALRWGGPSPASARMVAGQCEVRVRVDGVEQWQAMPPEFCVFPTPTATATSAPTATPTVEPTATAIPATATATATPSLSGWHAPTDHEHGDAPPAWVNQWIAANASAYGASQLVYGGDEATSPLEDGMKHAAFKGFALTSPGGTAIYLRYHAAANPMDRSAQFHSYEVWWRDTQGGISFMQGWYDTGSPEPFPSGNRFPRVNGETDRRPVMLVVDRATLGDGVGNDCEQWYMFGQGYGRPDFALTICGVPYLYNATENATAHDVTTWERNPQGGSGLHRRAEAFFFPDRAGVGVFWRTPQGVPCTQGEPGCLYNSIAPTLDADARNEFGTVRISSVGERTFPGGGTVGPIN